MNDFRSICFVPGGNQKMLAKAPGIEADLVVFDLEDSVSEDQKDNARQAVGEALRQFKADGRKTSVRINSLDSPHAMVDLEAVFADCPDVIIVPKVTTGLELDDLDRKITRLEKQHDYPQGYLKLIVLTGEVPKALFHYESLTNPSGRVVGMTWGAEDLMAELGATANRDLKTGWLPPFELARTLCLAKARELDVQPIDTVYSDFRDLDGLRNECEAAKRIGYAGKLVIHPAQVKIINEVFTPSAEEIEHAQKIIDLFTENPGQGALQLDGKMVDVPHLNLARRVISRYKELGSNQKR